MGHQTPSFLEIKKIIAGLRNAYKGSNPQRVAFIELCEKIAASVSKNDSYAQQILLGLFAFELETIEKEYWARSATNSRLYAYLVAQLDIKKDNPFTHEERLICIGRLFNYLGKQKNPSPELMKHLKSSMRYALKMQWQEIDKMINRRPTLTALMGKSRDIVADYIEETSSRILGNSDRTRQSAFLRYIEATCEKLYDNNYDDPEAQYKALSTRLGALLLVAWEIRETYRGSWSILTKPDNSVLYKACRTALNVEDILNIQADVKYLWLAQLTKHVSDVDEKLTNQLDEKGQPMTLTQVMAQEIPELKNTFIAMRSKLGDFTIKACTEKNKRCFAERTVASATEVAARYGLSIYAAEYIATQNLLPEIGGAVIDSAAGALGGAVLGPPGAMAFKYVSQKIRENLLPVAAGALMGFFISKASAKIGDTTGKMAVCAAEAAAGGVKSMLGFVKENNDGSINPEWVEVLLSLPEDVFETKHKTRIEMTHDFPRLKGEDGEASASPPAMLTH